MKNPSLYRLLMPLSLLGMAAGLHAEDPIDFGKDLATHNPLKVSFESAASGDTSGAGIGGPQDNLPWNDFGTADVQAEADLPNPPVPGGNCLLVENDVARWYSGAIDVRDVNNSRITVTVDLRSFEDDPASDWEDVDNVAVYLEGSMDGMNFVILSEILPMTSGDSGIVTNDPTDPASDALKKLELPRGGYTTFSLGQVDMPNDLINTIRIQVSGRNDSADERFYIDNVCVGLASPPSAPDLNLAWNPVDNAPVLTWNPEEMQASGGAWVLKRSSKLDRATALTWSGDLTAQSSVTFPRSLREFYWLDFVPD